MADINNIEEEIELIIKHGRELDADIKIIASNIVYMLNKCYNIDIDNVIRNDRNWIG